MPMSVVRRRTALQSASAAFALAATKRPGVLSAAAPAGIYARLLDRWTRALLALQVRAPALETISGGIACPLCARLHGRAVDAVYPLLAQARRTGDARFVDAAVQLFRWADAAGGRPDGSFANEPTAMEWRGITVFATIALSEALHHHGTLLDAPTRARWSERLRRAVAFLEAFFDGQRSANVNYPLSVPAALALAGRALDDDGMAKRARARLTDLPTWFTPQGHLIFGEAQPPHGRTPRDRYPVDLLYNVEETLPNLVLYARAADDREVLELVTASLHAHARFMLPDGAWDGGWGVRSYKWAYWGSRTTDGCQPAYGLLADRDPVFAEVARRNAQLLESCTHDGLVHGGPHLHLQGERPCVHHTFCRAKAMAWMVDAQVAEPRTPVPLPRQLARGVEPYPEVGTDLVAHGPWRATITTYDGRYGGPGGHPGGGALTMLWHEALGPVCVASLSRYDVEREPANMAPHRGSGMAPVLTPRLESGSRSNIHDETADVRWTTDTVGPVATVTARLQEVGGKAVGPRVQLRYVFRDRSVTIEARLDEDAGAPVSLVVPVVASREQPVRGDSPQSLTIQGPRGRLRVQASAALDGGWGGARIFQHVPGLQAVPVSTVVTRLEPASITLSVA